MNMKAKVERDKKTSDKKGQKSQSLIKQNVKNKVLFKNWWSRQELKDLQKEVKRTQESHLKPALQGWESKKHMEVQVVLENLSQDEKGGKGKK